MINVMDNSLVSVIVPIYNSEKYLERCIVSILNQTYRNLELLLIDDGSTDGSSAICYEYQVKDRRVRVFHKKNEGVGVARNYGLNQMSERGGMLHLLTVMTGLNQKCLKFLLTKFKNITRSLLVVPR